MGPKNVIQFHGWMDQWTDRVKKECNLLPAGTVKGAKLMIGTRKKQQCENTYCVVFVFFTEDDKGMLNSSSSSLTSEIIS